MTDAATRETLERECAVFARYLAGQEAVPAVVTAYVDFHARAAARLPAATRADRMILGFARVGTVPARLAAAYAARFRKVSPLPSKLVLVLALLECCPPAFESFEVPGVGGRTLVRTRLAIRGLAEGMYALVGTVLLGPLHVVLALVPERRS